MALPVIYFHSVRTFVLASLFADSEKWTFDRELVMLASLFHDVGLTVRARASRPPLRGGQRGASA